MNSLEFCLCPFLPPLPFPLFCGVGPSAPKKNRDMSLPLWWTVQHDIALLVAVAEDTRPRVRPLTCNTSSSSSSSSSSAMSTSDDKEAVEADDAVNATGCVTAEEDKEKDNDKEKEKEVAGVNWKRVAADPTVSRAAPSFCMPDRTSG